MPSESITRPEAKRRLSALVDDLARNVDYLQEVGVTEVVCESAFAPDNKPLTETPPNAARPQPKQPSNSEHRMKETFSAKSMPVMDAAQKATPRPVTPIAPAVADAGAGTGSDAELKSIAREVVACKKCALHEKRIQAVPGQGCLHPDILFIGEGPGEDEDKQGLAFVGRAGQMLTRLIIRMGYTRDEVFIANIVKCRPPNNRKPLPEEMNMCRPYLERQIAALKPKTIVLLGASAYEGLLLAKTPGMTISRVRGKWLEYQGIPTMPTFHPSYLLRNPSAMWDVWSDMQLVLKHLGRTPPPAPAKVK